MNPASSGRAVRVAGPLALSALATILLAAVDPGRNEARLKAMPVEERQRLLENLRKFELLYSPREQQAVRELDRRVNELEPERRAFYLAVLRRYHNWLNRLPDAKRDELKTTAPEQRMALVKKLLTDNPVPRADTPQFLKITDVGADSPLELAALYKIWQAMTAAQKQNVEQKPDPDNRRRFLQTFADRKNLPHEIIPPDFNEAASTDHIEPLLKKSRPGLAPAIDEIKKRLANDAAKNKRKDARLAEIMRRLAINHYFLEHEVAPVSPERLAQFLSAFPSWIQSTFDSYPPDEAQRRLTIVYRLVYPHPAEIPPAPTKSASTSGRETSPARGAPRSQTQPERPGRPAPGSSPF